ncbi:MAG: hypothetical protein IJW82_03400 [Clostridia bacterium]|nr:hypothetical protein [Clostridia bacterium]
MTNNKDNMINFVPKSTEISDNDLMSLFMGVFKLALKKAEMDAEEKYKKELQEKDNLIKKIKSENVILYQKINNKNLF